MFWIYFLYLLFLLRYIFPFHHKRTTNFRWLCALHHNLVATMIRKSVLICSLGLSIGCSKIPAYHCFLLCIFHSARIDFCVWKQKMDSFSFCSIHFILFSKYKFYTMSTWSSFCSSVLSMNLWNQQYSPIDGTHSHSEKSIRLGSLTYLHNFHI